MDSLIYSLNATVPVFLVIILGYFLRYIKMFDEPFLKAADKFNFKVTLPAMLFMDLAVTDFAAVFDLKYVIYCFVVTLLCILGIWGLTKLFIKDKSISGEFVQASYRSSAAVLGIALVVNISGDSGMIPLMILGAVPLYNIFAVIILTFEGKNREEGMIKKAFADILKNPIIISIVLGFLYSMLKLSMPEILETAINNVAKMATPLALICIGAGFEGKKAVKMIKPTLVASTIKLVLQSVVFLPLAVWLGFTGDKLLALMIMLGSPTTPSSYVMARNMGHEGVLTSSVIVMTTILSSFTITGEIFIMKQLGLV
ncbi:MAG: AEC family transporter [Lachnospiraceae bacterium]|nr:AEC family transporter [Lachnospiraceae bacterium]MCI8825122.1 AEC family transporter [Lachnospiraceae bacterium]